MHEPTEKTSSVEALAATRSGRVDASLEQFVQVHGLAPHVDCARKLATEEFQTLTRPHVSLSEDPDTAEQWVEVALVVRGSPDDVVSAHNRYTRRWLAATPVDIVPLVRLAYEVA